MTIGWIAGAVRGHDLSRRRLGNDGVRQLSERQSLADALEFLSASSYGRYVRADLDVAGAQRAIAETSVWHLRVLAGWLPPSGVRAVRALAGWFELLNLENHVVRLATADRFDERPFALGALAVVWPRAVQTTTSDELRVVLAHSEWGDPSGDSLADILVGLRLGWSRRLRAIGPMLVSRLRSPRPSSSTPSRPRFDPWSARRRLPSSG